MPVDVVSPVPEQYPSWITQDFVMGHFDPAKHPEFVVIDKKYADREGLFLHRDTYRAFLRMWEAAGQEGHQLVIRSATRNFDYQKRLWDQKWSGLTILSDGTSANEIPDPEIRARKILLYSSMPGTSRHHWGTDIDLNSFNNEYFETGAGEKLYQWLTEHGASFGFCQPYTDKSSGRTGYEEEKWHWSYIPLSGKLTSYCRDYISNDLISGFKGSEVAQKVDMLMNYILGINPECL